MTTQTNTAISIARAPSRASALPSGTGIILAMAVGGLFWIGLFALLT